MPLCCRTIRRVLPLLLGAVLALAASPCRADDPPEGQLRTTVEALTVTVQVWDAGGNRPLETGSGIIVSDSTPMLTILTARHVVDLALAKDAAAAGLVVRLRFNGSPRWIDAASTVALGEADQDLDAAAVLVARDKSPLAAGDLAKSLSIAPQPVTGTRLWVYALDPARDVLAWRKCSSTTATEATIAFDGEGVVPGCSGGPVLAEQGLVALVRTEGPRNRDHAGTPLRAVLAACQKRQIPVDVAADPVRAALDLVLARGLAIGLSVTRADRRGSASGWGAVELKEAAADRFSGRAVSPEGSAACTLSLEDRAWRLALDAPLTMQGSAARLSPGPIVLKPATGAALDGFLLLEGSTADADVLVAVPTRACELFGCRALLGAALGRRGVGPDLPAPSKGMFQARATRVHGKPALFPLRLDSDSFLDATMSLKLHSDRPIRVSGLLAMPEDAGDARVAERAQRVWSALSLELRAGGEAGGKVLSSAKMRPGERIQMRIDKSPDLLRLRHSGGGESRAYEGMQNRGPVVCGLTIEYTP